MKYLIRKSVLEDMKRVEAAHRESILKICSKDYSPEQIEKFSQVKYTDDIWQNSVGNEFHIVVEIEGEVEGFCHAKVREDGNGEIVGLYLTPKAQGKKIGREIVEQAFDFLKQFNPSKIVLNGTKTAKPFYEKMGFKVIEEKKSLIRGIEIESFYMEKITS